jgi:hypothetical protein
VITKTVFRTLCVSRGASHSAAVLGHCDTRSDLSLGSPFGQLPSESAITERSSDFQSRETRCANAWGGTTKRVFGRLVIQSYQFPGGHNRRQIFRQIARSERPFSREKEPRRNLYEFTLVDRGDRRKGDKPPHWTHTSALPD